MTTVLSRRLSTALLAAPTLLLLTLVLPAAPASSAAPAASAASAPAAQAAPAVALAVCTPLDLADETQVRGRADQVDLVFVGRVDAVVRRPVGRRPRPRELVHRVTVTTVLQGRERVRLGQRVKVLFGRSAEGRNRVLRPRGLHLFFVDAPVAGDLRADFCDGSVPLPDGLSARLQRTLEGFLRSEPEPPVQVELTAPEGGADEGPELSRVVAPGAAISLIGVLGLFLVARLGRRRG